MNLEEVISKPDAEHGLNTLWKEQEDSLRKTLADHKMARTDADEPYDVIVVGVGSMGASALYHLSKRGVRVLGIEQFQIGHKQGSHSGQSRLIRKAYFEHPDYVPLLERAYQNWKKLEQETGRKLYHETGLAYFGYRKGELLQGVLNSADTYDIRISQHDSEAFTDAHPAFKIPANKTALFEREAGYISPEKTIWTFVQEALNNEADIAEGESLLSWEEDGDLIRVETDKSGYTARKIIFTAGAYTGRLLPVLKPYLTVTRQLMMWVRPEHPEAYTSEKGFPCWVLEDEDHSGVFYGFPIPGNQDLPGPAGLKIAHHDAAEIINPADLHDFDPAEEEKKLMDILREYIPGALSKVEAIQACMYTNSPDGDFIIDRMQGREDKITYACGFSGHGFKFVPVIGEILADLSLNGETDLPIDFLSSKRLK